MRKLGRRTRRSDGQALVEFALLVPLLVIIILVIIEFGRIWMTMNVLASAAREGARVAAVTSASSFPNPAQVQTAVDNVLTAADITGATITTTGPNAANQVTVRVQITYSVVTGSFVPGLSSSMPLSRSVVMHWEG